MPHILGLRIKNFRILKDITLGQLAGTKKDKKISPLSPLTVVIGKNGSGKSVLLDVFGFLADCLKLGVESACQKRGRYGRIVSQGQTGPIEFEIYYKEYGRNRRPFTYRLCIACDESGQPCVAKESLSQEKINGGSDIFLELEKGRGRAWSAEKAKADHEERTNLINELNKYIEKQLSKNANSKEGIAVSSNIDTWIENFFSEKKAFFENQDKTENIVLANTDTLGLAAWGAFNDNPRIVAFRNFMEGWYLCYFTPDAARFSRFTEPQEQLSKHGGNLANVVQFMEKNCPQEFAIVLKKIAKKIPGIDKISTQTSADGRLLLSFNDKAFKEPFFAPQMSDGTLKLFAYMLMLEIPDPPPFICIEEPENGLYHKLLGSLVSEFRDHAKKATGGSQIFLTTHQPYLLDALSPKEVWILKKQNDGFSAIERASDNERVTRLIEAGDTLGEMWFSNYFD